MLGYLNSVSTVVTCERMAAAFSTVHCVKAAENAPGIQGMMEVRGCVDVDRAD